MAAGKPGAGQECRGIGLFPQKQDHPSIIHPPFHDPFPSGFDAQLDHVHLFHPGFTQHALWVWGRRRAAGIEPELARFCKTKAYNVKKCGVKFNVPK